MENIIFANYKVICETLNCGNADVLINIEAPAENPNFICGVCAQPITNIEKVDN